MSFYNLFVTGFVVLIRREIVRQRRWRHIATADAGVDKLPDYLRSGTKEKENSLSAVIICLATVNYQKIIHHRKL